MNMILASWKTTVQSILTVLIGLSGISIPTGLLTPKQALWLALVPSVAKLILGVFQQDAGVVIAAKPGEFPQVVASHEVPDDPKATVSK